MTILGFILIAVLGQYVEIAPVLFTQEQCISALSETIAHNPPEALKQLDFLGCVPITKGE